jgi:transposase
LRLRVAVECGTHSPWVSRLLSELGHQVVVANARRIPVITASTSKNDRNDAQQLGAWRPTIPGCSRRSSIAARSDSRI